MSDSLRFELLKWQQKVFSDPTRFKVVVAGRRCGKTRMSAVSLLVKAMECKHTDATILYVAPTFQMARTLMWNLLLVLGDPIIKKSNVNDGEITLLNNVIIRIRGADNPDSLRGMKLYYVVCDEFKDVKPATWELILRPALSDLKAGALIIGTPEPGESLFREYFDLGDSETDPEWRSWHFTTLDNELIDPKEIEAAKRSMSTFAFRQEYMASFDTMGADVFKEEWFRTSAEPRGGDYYIAVDLAGFEDVSDPNKKKHLDDTAIAVVKVTDDGHWWVKKVEMFRKDVRETAVRILMNIRTYKPICVGIEKGSLQRAVMPYLTDLMGKNNLYCHVEAIPTSSNSKENRVIYALQGLFEHGRIKFSDTEDHTKLKTQLLMFPSKKAHDDGCFPADTPIITLDGVKPIVQVTRDDYVLTRNGYRRVLKAWCRGTKEIITRFGITATPDHQIWTENREWVRLDSLSNDDILLVAQPVRSTSCDSQSYSTVGGSIDTQTQNNPTTENTTLLTPDGKLPRSCYIGRSGSFITGQFQMGITSTTLTGTQTTTISETLSASQKLPTWWSIEKLPSLEVEHRSILNDLQSNENLQRLGMLRQKVESGIDNTLYEVLQKSSQNNPVSSVGQCTGQKSIAQGCAAKSVSGSEQTSCSVSAMPVYDLMVEGNHEFFAYGVLAHNCDALSMIAHLHTTIYGDADPVEEYQVLDEVVGF